MIKTSSDLPQKSWVIFGNLWQSLEIFGNVWTRFVWSLDNFWRIFRNVRKIVKKRSQYVYIVNRIIIHGCLQIWNFSSHVHTYMCPACINLYFIVYLKFTVLQPTFWDPCYLINMLFLELAHVNESDFQFWFQLLPLVTLCLMSLEQGKRICNHMLFVRIILFMWQNCCLEQIDGLLQLSISGQYIYGIFHTTKAAARNKVHLTFKCSFIRSLK